MIGLLDLATGTFTKFAGKGLGLINGIAVDSEDGVLCTTVSFVPTVQFYDLDHEARLQCASSRERPTHFPAVRQLCSIR